MAVQTESPTLGRGTDWNSFYGTEPLEANDPFSPSAFGQLLFAEPDAASARGLLGIAGALLDLTFADIGGTIGLDQLPPGSVASLDSIDQDALYFFNNTTGLPELISAAETVAFISPALNFSDIQGNLAIDQFPPGTVVSIDSIDEDALYFFDNTLFQPRLINAADTLTFLGITGGGSFLSANTARVDASGNDSTGTIGDLGKPFLTVQGAIDALEAIDAADAVIDIGNNNFQTEDVTLDANHVTSLSFKGVNLEAGSHAFNSLTVNNDSGKTVYLNFFDTNFGRFGGITTGADLLYVLMPGGYGRSVTNTVGSIVLSAETQTGEIDGNITAVGDITCQGLSQIQGTITSTGAGTIRIKNCRPFFADDTNGTYLGLPTIDSAGSEVWVTGSPIQSVTAAGTLHLIDSRVAGTNNATSTLYADALLLPRYQMSIDFDAIAGLKLLNDSATPGNSKYYGTDSGGTKGYFALAGGGDASTNTSSSVDSEVALFSGTAGKTLKRATGSGLAVLTSGVLSTTTNNSSNWDTAFTERHQWDGGATNLVAATGRTSLGLVIGTNVQAWDTDLDTLAGLTATTNNFIVSVGSAWASRTPTQVKSTLAIANTDVSGLGTASTLASDTDGTLATNSDSRIATQKAVKTYIDGVNTTLLAAIAALDSKDEVAYCSTSALPTCTYSNGSLGVGATLTATTNGPLIIDGVTTVLGAQGRGVLVAGQASDFQNGWYTLTQQGVVAVSPWILTRRAPDDQAAEIGPGYLTAVEAPTGLTAGANNQKVFLSISPVPFVVGTDSLTFAMVGGTYTAGNGLSLSGTAFSINTSITADLSTAQSLSNKTFVAPILGTPTSGTLTNCTFPTLNQNTTGSAATLTTARGIYGNNFDGSAALTQIIASTYGGTGNGFTKFSGPTTAERTKTLRDASDTILELGGSYTPTGTWTSLTMVTPVLGVPTSGTLTNCTGLPEGGLSTTDITTNNVSTTKHGFAPKVPNDATKFLDGTGAYSAPLGCLVSANTPAADTINANGAGSGLTQNFATTYSIPANTLVTGHGLYVDIIYSITTSGSPPTIEFILKLGSTIMYQANAVTPSANLSARIGGASFLIAGTAAAGASANVITGCLTSAGTGAVNALLGITNGDQTATPIALATNGTLTLQPALQCGTNTAGNSVTLLALNVLQF